MFKDEWGHLLRNTKTINLFGVEIEVEQNSMQNLELQITEYEKNITGLSKRSTQQDSIILGMSTNVTALIQQIANCKEAKKEASDIQNQIGRASVLSRDIRVQTDVLRKTKILKKINL